MFNDHDYLTRWWAVVGAGVLAAVLWLLFDLGTVSVTAIVVLLVAVFARNAWTSLWRWTGRDD